MPKPVGTKFLCWNGKEGRVVRNRRGGLAMEIEKCDILMPYNEEYVQEWLGMDFDEE